MYTTVATNYPIDFLIKRVTVKTKVVSWFSLVIRQTPGQNTSCQLGTSAENVVASAQLLVALAISKSQFPTLYHTFVIFPVLFKQLALSLRNFSSAVRTFTASIRNFSAAIQIVFETIARTSVFQLFFSCSPVVNFDHLTDTFVSVSDVFA